MQPTRRTRIAALLILAALAWSPGVLFAGCAAACPMAGASAKLPCCRTHSAAPAMRAASCCETLKAGASAETSRAVRPPASVLFVLVTPLALLAEPVSPPTVAALVSEPPPLHEGIGLYTLHATFLI